MIKSKLLCLASLAVAIAAVAVAVLTWWAAERASTRAGDDNVRKGSTTDWLRGTSEERFQEVERQLRGLDVAMVEIGYRFVELYFAGRDGNWEYAKYQTEKIETALQRALVRRPKRAQSAMPFLNDDLPAVVDAVEHRNAEAFLSAMERLRTACMKCHVREEVVYFTVEVPERRLSPIRALP